MPILQGMQTITGQRRTSVFLVEDSAAIRARLAGRLRTFEHVDIVGEAESAPAAVVGILVAHPDAVLLDIHLAEDTGLDVLRQIHTRAPATTFIVLTNQPDERYRKLYLDAGAAYFLDKSYEFDHAVQLVADRTARSSARLQS